MSVMVQQQEEAEEALDWHAQIAERLVRFGSREEWLAGRQRGIGGSEVAIVMGVSKWGSRYSLWSRKTGIDPGTDFDNDILEFGRLIEPMIATRYAEKTGRELIDLGLAIRQHPRCPFLFVSHDRMIAPVAGHDGPGVLSIKSVNPWIDQGDWEEAEAPLIYQIQLQAELAASGCSWGSFGFLRWGKPVQWFDVPRNDRFIAAMEKECGEFWEMVESGNPPAIDGSDHTSEALKRIYPEADKGAIVDLPAESAAWTTELEAVNAQLKEIEERRETLRNQLRAAIGAAEVGAVPGGPRWKLATVNRAGFFTQPTTYRSLTRIKEKK